MTSCDENDVTWGDRVHYRERGPGGRAQGVTVTLTRSMMGGKTGPGVDPAGWQSNKGYNRAHLLGAQIGGSNKDPRNFVTMHAYANRPKMMRRIQRETASSPKASGWRHRARTDSSSCPRSRLPLPTRSIYPTISGTEKGQVQ
ncbi:DNA/RNA non-specific endonuclease [Streptomyces sp. 35G-GA-8]|uniref:DNA/RNA non-specific endonuclease n=1 Tax=Streptomyces sp. 35G-GA-8 TaxID=2939434 RepID=UPI0035AE948F